jgi:hypothetical protein
MVKILPQTLDEFGIPDAVVLGYENLVYPFLLLVGGLIFAVALLVMEQVKYRHYLTIYALPVK